MKWLYTAGCILVLMLVVVACSDDTPVDNALAGKQDQLIDSTAVVASQGQGSWSAVQQWPLIATHMANLTDGRILAWSAYDTGRYQGVGGNPDYTQATIFDPQTGTFEEADNPTHDMFCAGLATLSDGRILAAGGGSGQNNNNKKLSIFDGSTWRRGADMPNGHWYGTAVVDSSDNVMVSLGTSPEFNKTDLLSSNGTWKNLSGIDLAGTENIADGLETPFFYPALHLSPRGTIFHSGPTTEMHELTVGGNGTTVSKGNRNQDGVTDEVYRQYGNAIMVDEGKIMLTGGAPKERNPGSLNTSVMIDINSVNPVVSKLASMRYTRTFQHTILLPNGEIMVLGGEGLGVEFNDLESRLVPEIYNVETNTWRDVAAMSVPRNYHSTAILLQDGRVLAAGGGLCGCPADHQDGEIYSPPYLFNANGSPAARPVISSGPESIGYNQNFNVTVTGAEANSITRFSMIRFSASTHNINTDLRQDSLDFINQGNGSYRLTSHGSKNVVTPGYYFLFAVNSSGVPSVAKIIKIDPSITTNTNMSCQEISNTYGTHHNVTWGTAPQNIRELWSSQGCTTQPQTTPTTPTPASGFSIQTNDNKCVAVANNSTENGAKIVVVSCNGSTAQQFEEVASNGGFSLRNIGSSKCLDMDSNTNGIDYMQGTCNGGANQTFTWVGNTLVNKGTSKCVDQSGSRILQWQCHGGGNQQFRKQATQSQPNETLSCQEISNTYGTHHNVTWGTAPQNIRELWSSQGCTTQPQTTPTPTTPAPITPTPSPTSGVSIRTNNDTCVAVANNSTENGAKIVAVSCNGSTAQQFEEVSSNGGFSLRNMGSSKCLDMSGNSNGKDYIQWTCHGGANQTFNWVGNTLVNKDTGKCVDQSRGRILQWGCHGGGNQQFRKQ